jgi:hypothetical protein
MSVYRGIVTGWIPDMGTASRTLCLASPIIMRCIVSKKCSIHCCGRNDLHRDKTGKKDTVPPSFTLFFSLWLYTQLDLGCFFSFLILYMVGLLGRGTGRRKAATYTQNNTIREKMHIDIHASSGIQTHDPSVRVGEDSSCLRPHDHCYLPVFCMLGFKYLAFSATAENLCIQISRGKSLCQFQQHFGLCLNYSHPSTYTLHY